MPLKEWLRAHSSKHVVQWITSESEKGFQFHRGHFVLQGSIYGRLIIHDYVRKLFFAHAEIKYEL